MQDALCDVTKPFEGGFAMSHDGMTRWMTVGALLWKGGFKGKSAAKAPEWSVSRPSDVDVDKLAADEAICTVQRTDRGFPCVTVEMTDEDEGIIVSNMTREMR